MIRRLLAGAALSALAACSMQPAYQRPAAPVPPAFPSGDAYLAQSEAGLPIVSYTQIFRDPRLQAIIEQALVNNRDLRIAAANIAATRAQYRIERSALFPEVTVGGGATIADRGNSGVNRGIGTGTGGTGTGGTGTTGSGSGVSEVYSVDVGITAFELDLFGRIRSLSDSALNQYFATEAAARATRLTLVGDIATAWLTYASDRSLLTIAEQTAASAQRSVSLTRARLEGGIAPRTDLRQAELILTQAQSDLVQQKTLLAQDVNALQLLVGAPIDPAQLPTSIEQAAGTLSEVPAGLDSTVLLRRPDVVQAEYQLRSANADIGAARAELFPRISLTGVLGLASTALGSLFSGDAFNWSVSPNVDYSIFRAGAGRANVRLTEAQRDAAVATYELAIQTAFREVSDGLARRGTIAEQLRADTAQVAASQDNFTLTDARYRGGIDTFLASLDAQRSLYQSQRTLVATRLTQATNLVTLYRTLGGDAQIVATENGPVPVGDQPQS
ncbi:efflux transporter outer membrane subunit [Sphingomonas japonica]|uniref:Multidrug efflux system outer membrane protein n=1 Tax=Sphingomonas japonica TaxID=511662 RepID=A0ABX0U269_9SPHN|nr:efflux transporter outer membrane subunit [Sphingomonas japonica]NIJ24668.1 multidrug efflux system outer membrane protein [Sphingomonas japonica]